MNTAKKRLNNSSVLILPEAAERAAAGRLAGRLCRGMLAMAALLAAGCGAPPSGGDARPAQIYVVSEPSGVALLCDGALMSQTPATLRVEPGEHLITARGQGYEDVSVTIVARAGERIPVELKLEPLCGILLVHARPEIADVEINDAHYGKTPLLLPNFPLGRHRIRVSAPGFLPRIMEVELPDRTPVRVEAHLNSDAGRLQVDSKPPGATVKLNGAEQGKTPCRRPRIDVGSHVIEVSLPGHEIYREEFSVKAGEERRVNVVFTPLPGSLVVQTEPPGARIFINGQYRGDAPFTAGDLKPGNYVVRAELRGHAPAMTTNDVPLGGETMVALRLNRNSGAIIVSTEPPGVTVFLDGEQHGVTAARGEERISEQMTLDFVPEGRHTIQLTRQGCYDVMHTRMITSGQTEIIHEKMRARPVQFVATTVIRTGQGPAFTFRGIIRERFPNGDIKLEIEPGVFKTFHAAEILEIMPIAED